MAKKTKQNNLLNNVVPKRVLNSSKVALKSYDYYKKTSELIERANCAMGKKPPFKTNTGSTLNFKINHNAISSTTAQKI